jgi:hypothetical protein
MMEGRRTLRGVGAGRAFVVANARGIARLFLVACALLLNRQASAEPMPPGVRFEPVPAWVTALDTTNIPTPEADSGGVLLALDTQARVVRGEEAGFTRVLVRVTTELGVKTLGEQKFVFVPPYQTLVLHTLEVRRAGQAFSALRPGTVQVLQREARLESGVYDGARTAVVVLSDLRVGDEIMIESSVVGANPVKGGHIASQVRMRSTSGIGRLRSRILSDREISLRPFAGAPPPQVNTVGAFREYLWNIGSTEPFHIEDGTPPEADTVPWTQGTDFGSYSELVSWGRALFRVPAEVPKPLQEWRRELLEYPSTADRVVAALRMVQERIRYLSLSFDESSHRPANPALVLERGFGDCKDKSLLAVTLLRSLGLDADVALVSSTNGELLPRLLPAITLFDHVIVTVEVDRVRYWLDPTRLHQRGKLADVSARNFRFALRLADGVSDLVEIQEPEEDRPSVYVIMRYAVERLGGPTRLDVATTYVGPYAEAARGSKASGSAKQLSDQAAAPVLKIYPRALAGEARVEDLDAANEVVVHQTFELDADDWVPNKEGRKTLAIAPAWLGGALPPIRADRKSPVVTAYPLKVSHYIEVRAPMRFEIPSDERRVQSSVFDFRYRSQTHENELILNYGFEWRARRIKPAEFPAYRNAVAEAARLFDFSIFEPIEVKPASRATLFLSIALWSVVLLAALWYVQLRQPYFRLRRVAYRPELAGRKGWLAFLGFGVTISPLRFIAIVATASTYSQAGWTLVSSPGSPAYDAAWEPILTAALLINLTLFSIACYSVYLFWAGRRSFPLVYSALLALVIVSSVFDLAFYALFEPARKAMATPSEIQTFAKVFAIPIAALWIVYLSRSERVKATFLRKSGKRGTPTTQPA